jgi:TolA-binding protein
MKKILILSLMVLFMGSTISLLAQVDASAKIEQRQNRDKEQKKAPDVNTILERMEERKAEILNKLKTRFAKLNEKLATLSERVDKASERLAKLATSDNIDQKKTISSASRAVGRQ